MCTHTCTHVHMHTHAHMCLHAAQVERRRRKPSPAFQLGQTPFPGVPGVERKVRSAGKQWRQAPYTQRSLVPGHGRR